MIIKKTIYVNSSGVLTLLATDTNGFQIGGVPLVFKRGDTVTLNVVFLDADRSPITLTNGTELIMAVKPLNEYESTVLYAYKTLTVNGQAATGYDFTFDLNSTTLAEAMRLNEPFEADVASVTGMLELTWTTDGGATYRSTQNVAPFTVNNDVIRGDEATPLALPSPEAWLNQRAIRFDSTQSLSSVQKARAQANLGFPKTNWNAATAPDEDNDETEGYAVGSLWIDSTNKEAYRCVKDDEGAAEWIETTLEAAEVLALISNFNYTGPYDGGTEYAVGDLATMDGSLYYRKNANDGSVGDTPFDGSLFWDLIASAGSQGEKGDTGDKGDKGDTGDKGDQGIVYLGDYVSGNGYINGIAVVKGSDNNLYIAKASGGLADPVGNAAQWDLFLLKGSQGEQGPSGSAGQDGDDALWNYTGAYNGGTPYAVGDLAVLGGQLFYRKNSNGGNVGDTPFDGSSFWDLLASKGDQGVAGPEPTLSVVDTSVSTTALTLDDSYNNKVIRCTVGVVVTVPSTLSDGFSCMFIQEGSGQVTFAAESGTTLQSFGNMLKTAGLHAPASLIRVGTAVYNLSGNLV